MVIIWTTKNVFEELTLLSHLQAASLRIAEQYIQAFGNIAKEVRTDLFYFFFLFEKKKRFM